MGAGGSRGGNLASGTIAFLLGVLLLQQLPALPHGGWCAALPVLAWLAWRRPPWRLPSLFGAGFLWALLHAVLGAGSQLPEALEGRDLLVEGRVEGLPDHGGGVLRFVLAVERWLDPALADGPSRIRLSWYRTAPRLRSGERWQLRVRLKRPHGLLNPGGFDYEAWLHRRGVGATGYVREDPENRRLEASGHSLDGWRERLLDRIGAALAEQPLGGILAALAVGARGGIGARQWEVFTRTGTSHLVAISGLHVGLVAGLAWWLTFHGWRLSRRLALRCAAPRAAAAAALLAAAGYSALAGFSLPTTRALVMLGVLFGARLLMRPVRPGRGLALALLLILILDPLAVLDSGFWLSFGAVAAILFALAGRGGASRWLQSARLQLAVFLALAPLTLLLFQRVSLVGPLANLVAVPWMGLLVVPLTLAGTALLVILPGTGAWLLGAAHAVLSPLWAGLEWGAGLEWAQWSAPAPGPAAVLLAIAGVFLLLAPRGIPGRWLGMLWLLPLLWPAGQAPAPGAAEVAVLDVGQGLAVVVRTHGHLLVYDTGPGYGPGSDAGERVLVPYLRAIGAGNPDLLILSHGDGDHVGGADSLIRAYPPGRILGGGAAAATVAGAEACRDGMSWRWDGVEFRMLHPPGDGSWRDNAATCVLRVASGGASLLLGGDLEARGEARLLERHREAIAADALVVPHHGSETSSGADFVAAVRPRLAIYSAGYRNRFGFPRPPVVARYEAVGARGLVTAASGAILLTLPPAGRGGMTVRRHRETARRYWHAD